MNKHMSLTGEGIHYMIWGGTKNIVPYELKLNATPKIVFLPIMGENIPPPEHRPKLPGPSLVHGKKSPRKKSPVPPRP